MGTFHDVTTSTIERGNSTLRGLDTVKSLQRRLLVTQAASGFDWVVFLKRSPFQVVLLLAKTCPGQSRRGFAQIANEIIAEVEGQRVLARQQPPDTTATGDGSRWRVNFSSIVRMKPDK